MRKRESGTSAALPPPSKPLDRAVGRIETQRYAVYRPFPWKQQRRGPDGVGETRFSRSAVSRRQSPGRSLCAELAHIRVAPFPSRSILLVLAGPRNPANTEAAATPTTLSLPLPDNLGSAAPSRSMARLVRERSPKRRQRARRRRAADRGSDAPSASRSPLARTRNVAIGIVRFRARGSSKQSSARASFRIAACSVWQSRLRPACASSAWIRSPALQ